MEEPTGKQLYQVATAMFNAGRDMCEKVGIEFELYGVALACEGILDSMKTMCALHEALGYEGMRAFADAIENSEKYKMMQEAEEVINGGE